MFLTRAAQIIGKEGFRTFGYALQQKMHQNMTDEKAYGDYQKRIAQKQRITDNKADCTAICRHSGSYESMLAAVSGMDAEYIAVCDESCEFDKDYTAIVSHYIRIQKRAGRSLSYIYTDSENYNQKSGCGLPDCKPDYSWDTLLSYNYIGDAFVANKNALIDAINECKNLGAGDNINYYELSLMILSGCKRTDVGHIHQVLVKDIRTDNKSDRIADGTVAAFKKMLLNKLEINADVIADKHDSAVEHVHYIPNEHDLVSIIIPSKDNPDILKCCLQSISKFTKYINYEIVVVDNGSNDSNRKEYEKLVDTFEGQASYVYEKADFNFSHMCNTGAAKARGNLLLFLNDDIEIIGQDYEDTDWLSVLAGQAKQESTGAVGAKLLYPDSSYIQHVGVINYESSCFAHLYAKAVDDEDIKAHRNYADYDCLCVTGACFMLEKAKFDKAGGFDEAFEVTHNDVDICLTLYEQGYYNVLRNDVVLFHHESFSRGDDEVDEEKNRRNMHARDLTYEKHPKLEKYDPFYSPLLTQTENNYRFGDEIYSVIYRKPQKADRLNPAAGYIEVSPTVKVTETGYHDDMQFRGFAYNGNKVYYNPVIFLCNEQNCYRIKAQSVCDRVFHLRKGADKNINYAPFFCGIDTTDMESGTYKCVIRANGKYYDAQARIVINDEDEDSIAQ